MATYFIDGRLTRNAEMKSTKEGKQFVKFTVAWNRGEKKDTHFYSCTISGDRANKIFPYLTQGKYVIVTGEPDWHEYEGKTYETIRVDKLNFAGNAQETLPNQSTQNNPEGKPFHKDGKFFDTREELEAYIKSTQTNGPEEYDDSDIPF